MAGRNTEHAGKGIRVVENDKSPAQAAMDKIADVNNRAAQFAASQYQPGEETVLAVSNYDDLMTLNAMLSNGFETSREPITAKLQFEEGGLIDATMFTIKRNKITKVTIGAADVENRKPDAD